MGEAIGTSRALPFIAHHRKRNDGCKSKKHEMEGAIDEPKRHVYRSRVMSKKLVAAGVVLLARPPRITTEVVR